MDSISTLSTGWPGASGTASTQVCPACGCSEVEPFFDFGEMPTRIGVQCLSRQEALESPRGHIELAFCRDCSLVTNTRYCAAMMDYASAYDNDLGFSMVYQEYEQRLINRLIRNYNVRNKSVIEIGCGNGSFIKRLCNAGANTGIGFDPSLEHSPASSSKDVELIAGYYPGGIDPSLADLIVCRQVLEHLPDPLSFLVDLRTSLRDSRHTVLYFEVPNFEFVLDELALWTVIYEHCTYFTRESLAWVFEAAGFEVQAVYDCFEGQFLGIEALPIAVRPGHKPVPDGRISDRIDAFVKKLNNKILNWKQELEAPRFSGTRAVLWGAGARAVTFCNLLKAGDRLPYVVDVNPNKAGKYLPGTAQQIVAPAFLKEYQPGAIIVMNEIYRDEIRKSVEALGLKPEFLFA